MGAEMQLAKKIIELLDGRSGFDSWWHAIDPEVQNEILEDLVTLIDENGGLK